MLPAPRTDAQTADGVTLLLARLDAEHRFGAAVVRAYTDARCWSWQVEDHVLRLIPHPAHDCAARGARLDDRGRLRLPIWAIRAVGWRDGERLVLSYAAPDLLLAPFPPITAVPTTATIAGQVGGAA